MAGRLPDWLNDWLMWPVRLAADIRLHLRYCAKWKKKKMGEIRRGAESEWRRIVIEKKTERELWLRAMFPAVILLSTEAENTEL